GRGRVAMQGIFLVGPMGSGKSTVGRLLARRLRYSFYDTDREVEVRAGATVSEIFRTEGETGFRRRESHALRQLSRRPRTVLATGGGAVLDSRNVSCLVRNGVVVYLRAAPEELARRVAGDASRPLLQGRELLSRIRELLRERAPCYERIADLTVDSDQLAAAAVSERICAWLDSR
ncbi:MAG: shikimate kinase, partial [Gammaproteobacteria bacterium]|nr:shikimate kinase [Gammaproteobacteria bacterium]